MSIRRFTFRAMGSPCEIQLGDDPGADVVAREAIAEVQRLEEKYTRFEPTSVTSAINRTAGDPNGIALDTESASLVDYAAIAHRESRGLFDATSGVLRAVWNWKSGRAPSQAQINSVLPRIGWEKVDWHTPRLALPIPGMQIDLGGIVKEYAADRVAELCRSLGARHGLVDLGGDIAIVGPRPGGVAWAIGIRNPRQPDRAIAKIDLHEGAIASSGDYERFMFVNGVRYCHILDPRTGWPAHGLAAVSVVAPHCVVAGSGATIAMLKPESDARAWLVELGLPSLSIDSRLGVGGDLVSAPATEAARA